jgi:hypothetical protein
MARINHESPKAYLNDHAQCIIDANFATLWTDPTIEARLTPYALLALLNSVWTAAVLEHAAAVMGGGALKVEAAHLRMLPIPNLSDAARTHLTVLGQRLACETQPPLLEPLIETINAVVATAALGRKASAADLQALKALAEMSRAQRRQHHRKGTVR